MSDRIKKIALITAICLLIRGAVFVFTGAPWEFGSPISWIQWDAVYYVKIPQYGYVSPTYSEDVRAFIGRFPPLYPFSIYLLSWLPLGIGTLGILLSTLCMVIASNIIYHLTFFETGKSDCAIWAVLFLNLFPTAYFANTAYAEAMSLMFLTMYFYVIRIKKNFQYSSLLLALLLMTRTFFVVLIPLHAFIYLSVSEFKFKKKEFLYFLIPIIALSAQILLMKYFVQITGYLDSKDASSIKLGFIPFIDIYNNVMVLIKDFSQIKNLSFWTSRGCSSLSMILSIPCLYLVTKRMNRVYAIYSVTFIVFMSLLVWKISAPRFFLMLLPLFILFASFSNWIRIPLALSFGGGMFYLANIFVKGSWAF